MNKIILGVLILIVAACNNNQNTTNSTKTINTPLKEKTIRLVSNMRNKRYCEILVIKGNLSNLTATVFNTIGCNDCPVAIWNAINVEKLKDSLKAKAINRNGPRVFLMDKIGQTNVVPPKVMLGGLAMIERATVSVSLATVMAGKSKPYQENSIKRSTEYVFLKQKKIYKLISPKYTYIMQSYSLIVNKTLNEKALEILETKLNLPRGWQYQVETLTQDLVLKTVEDGEAYVIQDDLQNTYQRIKN